MTNLKNLELLSVGEKVLQLLALVKPYLTADSAGAPFDVITNSMSLCTGGLQSRMRGVLYHREYCVASLNTLWHHW